MAGPTDMSELHLALDRLRPQLCHCGFKGECLGCKGIEMVRAQAEAVVAAASPPLRRADAGAPHVRPRNPPAPGGADAPPGHPTRGDAELDQIVVAGLAGAAGL